jgi:serine protease Do
MKLRCRALWIGLVAVLGLWLGPGIPSVAGQTAPPVTFAQVVEALTPAVVTILPPADAPIGLLGDDDEEGDYPPLGSGVIVDARGVVLTNSRVASAPRIEVLTADGRRYRPTRVAVDERSDLAVLVIGDGATAFPFARLADSDHAKIGDWVLAMGAPLGFRTTVSAGVISARARDNAGLDAPDYLLTTAVVRFGSTGGPLVDLTGGVIGINTVFAFERAGLAFTIPSNVARAVVPQLLEHGRVTRASLGVIIQDLTPELARALKLERAAPGLLVGDVIPDGPAAATGIQPGDVLLAFDGRPLLARSDLPRALQDSRPGQEVVVHVRRRDGRKATVTARLIEDRDTTPTSLVTYRLPQLGCDVRSLTPDLGVVVSRAERPALESGLHAGDIVRELNHEAVRTVGDLARVADRLRPGQLVAMLVQRGRYAVYVVLRAGGESKAIR